MFRRALCALLFLVLCGGSLLAADATVVSYDKDTQKLVVKMGDKERTLELTKATHVHDANGKEVSAKDRAGKLTKETKLDVVEKNGKLVEINIKK
jgi:hypothetical protein